MKAVLRTESKNINPPAVEVVNVTKKMDEVYILKDISFKLCFGECVGIMGSNGSGKTTLLKIIASILKPTHGEVKISGNPISSRKVLNKLGVVFHNTFLYDAFSPLQNLRFYGKIYGVEDLDNKINGLLRELGLIHRKHDAVSSFSRGMKQRLTIARALLHDPDVLLMDEPYTGLDEEASHILDEIILRSKKAGKAVLLVTHRKDKSKKLFDNKIILKNGRIEGPGGG